VRRHAGRVAKRLGTPACFRARARTATRWAILSAIDEFGYDGDYSFEVFNDDYAQMPLALVAQRAKRSVQ
jgi:hypothetical protein